MSDLQSLLKLREDVFLQIDEAIVARNKNKFNELLETSQPEEWIKKGDSEFYSGKQYEYNDIELLEAILGRISTGWRTGIVATSTIQDKGQFAVTTHVHLLLIIGDGVWTTDVEGIATSYAPNIKHLTLATPKSVTDAIKNACKRIGRLLGRDLNRGIEDIPSIQIEAKESQIDAEFISAKNKVISLGTFEAAIEWMSQSPWKYNPELKNFINETYKKD